MALAGADCFLVVTPFFYKNAMTPKVLIDHFNEVADFAPKPVIIYNVPANTGLGKFQLGFQIDASEFKLTANQIEASKVATNKNLSI